VRPDKEEFSRLESYLRSAGFEIQFLPAKDPDFPFGRYRIRISDKSWERGYIDIPELNLLDISDQDTPLRLVYISENVIRVPLHITGAPSQFSPQSIEN